MRDLDKATKAVLKALDAGSARRRPTEETAYAELCRAVSIETDVALAAPARSGDAPATHADAVPHAAHRGWARTGCSAPRATRRCSFAVADTRDWRERFELKRFTVVDAHAGQPQVDWRAEILDRATSERARVDGLLRDPVVARQAAGQPRVQGAGDHAARGDPRLRPHVESGAELTPPWLPRLRRVAYQASNRRDPAGVQPADRCGRRLQTGRITEQVLGHERRLARRDDTCATGSHERVAPAG